MRKEREFTIIRESSKSSVRSRENLNPSLVEALFDENYDVSSLGSLNEERLKAPGYSKKDEKFVDQYSTVRDLAKEVPNKNAKEFEVNIPGVPKKITIVKNKFGISRVYTGASQADEEEAWKFRSDTKEEKFPVIEITPDTQPSTDLDSGDGEDDLSQQVDAEREQSRIDPENDEDGDETDAGAETSTNPTTVDPDVTDDDQEDLDADVRQAQDSADERWQTVKDREDSEREYDSTFSGPGGERIPPPEPDGRETFVGDGGGDMDPDDPRLKDPQTSSSEEEETGRPEGEPEGGDVIVGPPNGQGGGGQPQPPPTGDAKDVSDYIDKVAAGAETVDLSEIRRPLHKRSLVELLYSR